MTYDEYRALPGLAHSELRDWLTCPAYWMGKWKEKTLEEEQTDGMLFGSALDRFIEDEEGFHKEFVRAEGRRTTPRDALGRLILTPLVFDQVVQTGAAMKRHPTFKELTDGAMRQAVVSAPHPTLNLVLKGRLDFLKETEREVLIVDLKSTYKADWEDGFSRSFTIFGYAFQLAYYATLVSLSERYEGKSIRCALAVTDKERIRFYEIDEELLAKATDVLNTRLEAFVRQGRSEEELNPSSHTCPLGLNCPIQQSPMPLRAIGISDVPLWKFPVKRQDR